MKAPDKIYLQRNTTTDLYDDFWPEWFEDTHHPDSDICYIRKDLADEMVKSAEDHAYFAGQENLREKLLEWAKSQKARLKQGYKHDWKNDDILFGGTLILDNLIGLD